MEKEDRLYILWTNADLNTSLHMVFMYAKNSIIKGWWDHITVIIWGATALLAAENTLIQEEIKAAKALGVEISACVTCAKKLGSLESLEKQGIEIKPWGEPLTEILKANGKLLTV